jgi:hypothetical protein
MHAGGRRPAINLSGLDSDILPLDWTTRRLPISLRRGGSELLATLEQHREPHARRKLGARLGLDLGSSLTASSLTDAGVKSDRLGQV